jgi:hypothetical protein
LAEPALAERLLAEAARRALRYPEGRMALVLHLSRLPALRPHHRRVARAIFDDAALRNEGQVFALTGGDLVLLCRAPSGARAPGRVPDAPVPGRGGGPGPVVGANPLTLPQTLRRLLRNELTDPADLATLWRLDEEPRELMAYAATRFAEVAQGPGAPADPNGPPEPQTSTTGALVVLAETAPVADLLRRQMAVHLPHGLGADGRPELRPLLRELICRVDLLEARLGASGETSADPFLLRHLCARLDRRVLEMLVSALGRGGPIDLAAAGKVPVHLNLSLPTLLSEAFTALAALAGEVGARLGVEISFVEAVGDLGAFGRARRLLERLAIPLVLDEVSPLALSLSRPWLLGADLLKLAWVPRLADLPAEERPVMAAALERVGPERVILLGADDEAALRWGLTHGIRRFQGVASDALLAAARMLGCPHMRASPGACTLRQCLARSAASDIAGRADCSVPGLLDGGWPGASAAASPGRAA